METYQLLTVPDFSQQGYGLGSIFRGIFRWALPHVQQSAEMPGKKALQTGINVEQDVLA